MSDDLSVKTSKEWDREYVREKYKVAMLGIEGIYFPCANAKRLMVFFSSMGKDRFDRYSWYWEKNEIWEDTAYLFIKDDSFHYFLGTDDKPMKDSVRKVITYYQEQSNTNNELTYMVGGSMGGYAAIYFAFYTNARAAIVANPQISYKAARMHQFQNWERSIREMGSQWYDLDDFSKKYDVKPAIYIEYGNYMADKKGCESLISSLIEEECLLIIRKEKWEGHTVNSLFKKTIENAVFFFENEPKNLPVK
ncbi:hypothetical protein [Rahnella aquatilis]|uniref:hypothetical protein n=1 Tax=Rahnella aquatilis TaxID=34038 RepID=UPI00365D598B